MYHFIIILSYRNMITTYHEISYFGFNFDRKSALYLSRRNVNMGSEEISSKTSLSICRSTKIALKKSPIVELTHKRLVYEDR